MSDHRQNIYAALDAQLDHWADIVTLSRLGGKVPAELAERLEVDTAQEAAYPGDTARELADANIDHLLARAIEALPAQTHMVYVGLSDKLAGDEVGNLLLGDLAAVEDVMWGWEAEARYQSARDYLEDALGDDAAALEADEDAWQAFQEECDMRDVSDPLADLMLATPAPMVRYSLDFVVAPASYAVDAFELEGVARQIADAAGIDFAANRDTLILLAAEASYGGTLCVLHRTDLVSAADLAVYGGTAVFTSPYLLVYDGFNGSGACARITGTVRIKVAADTMTHDAGSYSWSDDIAGVVHSAFETPATFEVREC